MRKYIILFFSSTVFLFACNGSDAPDGIIERDRMTSLLSDVHLADGSMYSIKQDPDSLFKYGTGRYIDLFKKYHTDSTRFKKSLRYYASDPAGMADMYNKIMDKLKTKTDSLNKIRYKSIAK